jgi:hypothetical protein
MDIKQITKAYEAKSAIVNGDVVLAQTISNFHERAKHLKSLFPDLKVTLCGSWVWLEGKSFDVKEQLKAHGCRWSSKKVAWYLPGKKSARRFYGKNRKSYTMNEIKFKFNHEEIN